jgi:hypothetical protein
VVGLLADEARLRVFSAVALGARTPPEVAEAAGTNAKETALALRKLQAGGLVGEQDGELRALTGHLKDVLRAAACNQRPTGDASGDDREDATLRTFVRDGRLLSVPAQLGRRRTVLRHLARQSFTPGETYPERAVNDVLRAWSEGSGTDHVAIRRYLIELNLLDRADGRYWLRDES